jgi:glycosyltransferase involved in cell wall biosynthesis
VMAIAARDSRIRIAEPLSREAVPEALAGFDILAIPSQWLETGPIVALEAQAMGIPVLGSNLGGIAELVRHGIDGWLVPAKDVQAWAEAIATLAKDTDLLAFLRKGIQPVRTMDTVASEMVGLYKEILAINKKHFSY